MNEPSFVDTFHFRVADNDVAANDPVDDINPTDDDPPPTAGANDGCPTPDRDDTPRNEPAAAVVSVTTGSVDTGTVDTGSDTTGSDGAESTVTASDVTGPSNAGSTTVESTTAAATGNTAVNT